MSRNRPVPPADVLAVELETVAREAGVDLVGFATLGPLADAPTGIEHARSVLGRYRSAIVLGAQVGKLGSGAGDPDVCAFLERAAHAVLGRFEERRLPALIVHPNDEFDPVGRRGLVSLKVLAKAAGLGWQGRSLLVVSPRWGPVHRWIAVLTDRDLPTCAPVPNRCGECARCIEACPEGALELVPFADHPEHREDVLDVAACVGDDGCTVCLDVCPWLPRNRLAVV